MNSTAGSSSEFDGIYATSRKMGSLTVVGRVWEFNWLEVEPGRISSNNSDRQLFRWNVQVKHHRVCPAV